MCEFCHLHFHSEYSHDAISKLEEAMQRAKDLGQKHLALTDHGTMSGNWEAQKVADKVGIHLIHGCEFYYQRLIDEKNGHILVLAKNNEGLENMFKLHHMAHKNFHRRPRLSLDMLKENANGLIVTSACLANDMSQYIMEGRISEAKSYAKNLLDTFKDDFYVEIQPNGLAQQNIVNKYSIQIANELGIPYVATNDSHYVLKEDVKPHEVACALSTNSKMDDPKRFKLDTEELWLKSEEEMYDTFTELEKDVAGKGIRETVRIAEKCNARINSGHYLPKYHDIKDGYTERQQLVEEVKAGLVNRGLAKDKQYIKDVQGEINVIDDEGFAGYFLIVQDYIKSTRERGEIVGDGRGSAAGAKVSYLTEITNINPADYDLLFERFLTHGRVPDIDTDFSNQQAVFDDLRAKYGENSVARIVGFSKRTPKALARNIFRIFNEPHALQAKVSDLIPNTVKTMEQAYDLSDELYAMRHQYPEYFKHMERLQNTVSHSTLHAGGVIVYPNLNTLVPLQIDRDSGMNVVAWDKKMVESFGLIKFDVLGLETLPIVRNCLDSIEQMTGTRPDLTKIDLEDQNIYDMLCKGDVSGVFQISGQPAKVMEQQPRSFRDLIAINALIRPGVADWNEYIARRNGKEWSVHIDRLPYLEETSGLIAYQEQYLLDAKTFAGWDLAFADNNIRKNKDILNDKELREKFISDSVARGYDENEIIAIWEEISGIVSGGLILAHFKSL